MPTRVEDYEVLHTIGTGSYGRCQKIRRKSDGKVSAGTFPVPAPAAVSPADGGDLCHSTGSFQGRETASSGICMFLSFSLSLPFPSSSSCFDILRTFR